MAWRTGRVAIWYECDTPQRTVLVGGNRGDAPKCAGTHVSLLQRGGRAIAICSVCGQPISLGWVWGLLRAVLMGRLRSLLSR